MISIFISPNFPPTYYLFPVRLHEVGARVIGIGDAPEHELRPELRGALAEYVHVSEMGDYDAMLRAVAGVIHRHGRVRHLDSNNEHWLELEARLREDFNIPGQRPADTAINRKKSAMKARFVQAGVPVGPGARVDSAEAGRAFAARHGYPLILKPDTGVGAGGAFKVESADELERALAVIGGGYVIEVFLRGKLVSFDGLCDADGEIAHCTSHVFSAGIMETVRDLGPMHYYSLREIPADLEAVGRRTVAALGIRARFFHVEFFRLADGSLAALEANVRPPGGFTTDMMNYGADLDVYRLWAEVVTGRYRRRPPAPRTFHVAHVGRRRSRRYGSSHDELMARLGELVVMHAPIPEALSGAMGDYAYLVRSPSLAILQDAITQIERE